MCFIVLTSPGFLLQAQFGPLANSAQVPQAKTQEELDAYLEIITATEAQDIVKEVDVFASRYPKSELLGAAYQYQLQAFQDLGDFEAAIAAGEKALLASPRSVKTLLTLATVIANSPPHYPDRQKLLVQAGEYAREALQGIEVTKPPRQITLEKWESESREMQCQAHETQGVVLLDLGNPKTAIREFEAAISLTPNPNGAQFFRLGLAFASSGQSTYAKENFRHAVDLGPGSVRRLALEQIAKLPKVDQR